MSKANKGFWNNVSLKNNDEAVSPVIGTILMVAVTVIIAAVIAAFVFGFTGTMPKAPKVAYVDAKRTGDTVTLTNINTIAALSDVHLYIGSVLPTNEIKSTDTGAKSFKVPGTLDAPVNINLALSTLNGQVTLNHFGADGTTPNTDTVVPAGGSYKLIITASVNGAPNQAIEELNI